MDQATAIKYLEKINRINGKYQKLRPISPPPLNHPDAYEEFRRLFNPTPLELFLDSILES